jgi:uncharacterized peroxidase-related enzyme
MTWIRTIPLPEADDELRQAFEAQAMFFPSEYSDPEFPSPDEGVGIVATHTLIPGALRHAFSTFGVLISPDLPLSRKQHEMIATRVSGLNRCRYCFESHAEFLRHVTLDDDLVRALKEDYENAPLDPADRAMLDYAGKVTTKAISIGPSDHQALRDQGFDDRAILQITLIAAWFNYINRVADSLGVGRE